MANVNEILKKGQIVNIKGRKYTTIGGISYVEDNYSWKEYKLKSEFGDIIWLSYEIDEGEKVYSIHREQYSIRYNSSDNQVIYNNITYNLIEEGYERVTSYWGQVDVDLNETAKTREFRDASDKNIITIEDWDGEIEKCTGEIIQESDIQIQNEYEKIPVSTSKSYGHKTGCVPVIIIFMVVISIIPIVLNLNSNSIRKYLEKSSKYTYVTSITNETNKQKAKVYESNTSVDATVKDIIDNVPMSVQTVTDVSNSSDSTSEDSTEDGIGILTKSEYAYVYTSAEGRVYIQVSSKKYLDSSENNRNAYHSRTRYHHYYRSYTTSSKSSTYTSYAASARQSSINSRKSSGGGTSAGK